MSEYLFTYGTLRLDQSHPMAHFLAENASLVGLGILTKARLYRIDWYPALIETNDEQDEDECQTKYNYTHKTPKEWKKYKCINFKSKVVQENNTQHSLPIVDPDTTGTHKDDCAW